MLYLGLEGTVDHLAHHTVWLADDYAENLATIQAGRTLPRNPSLYVQNACVTDPGQAPPGCSALYVLVPVAHRTDAIDWATQRPAFRDLTLRQLERIGVTDVERRIRFEKCLTPASWETEMSIYRGATFNLTHSMDQMLMFRPRNRFEDLERVYLVGGGTHPGSGLPVIFESARITSRLLAEDLAPQSHRWNVKAFGRKGIAASGTGAS
jgi:phytoene desaturase